MITWGINALNHGSSLAVFDHYRLKSWEFCKSDTLDQTVITRSLTNGGPDNIFWYENPWVKKARQLYAGQYQDALDRSVLPRQYLKQAGLGYARLQYTPHHASHAAAGYYTSPFNHCAVVVLDAIGEFECASIWEGKHNRLKKVWSARYPNSLGLFYSAFTKMVGLTPIKDEYKLQQMAEQGDPFKFRSSVDLYFNSGMPVSLNYNFHRGVQDWSTEGWSYQDQCNLAASVQERFETEVLKVMFTAKELTGANSLVYMGGCAMNSKANRTMVEPRWKNIWSLPMPGDPSSAIGAVLYHTRKRVSDYNWDPVKHIAIRV